MSLVAPQMDHKSRFSKPTQSQQSQGVCPPDDGGISNLQMAEKCILSCQRLMLWLSMIHLPSFISKEQQWNRSISTLAPTAKDKMHRTPATKTDKTIPPQSPPSSPSKRTEVKQIYIIRIGLGFAILLVAVAPIFLHHLLLVVLRLPC